MSHIPMFADSCDKGWTGDRCNRPDRPLDTGMRESFNRLTGKSDPFTVHGGELTTQCDVLASGSALHFKGVITFKCLIT